MAMNPDMESVNDDDPTAALPVLTDYQKTETMLPARPALSARPEPSERRTRFRRRTDDELRDRVVKLEAKQRQQTILFEKVTKALTQKDREIAALKAEVVNISTVARPDEKKQRSLIRMVGTKNVKHNFDKALRIGRAPDNDVCLRDSSVSRYHAQLVADGDQTMISDLGSKNGVFVNGEPVTKKALSHRDLVKIGGAVFRFVIVSKE